MKAIWLAELILIGGAVLQRRLGFLRLFSVFGLLFLLHGPGLAFYNLAAGAGIVAILISGALSPAAQDKKKDDKKTDVKKKDDKKDADKKDADKKDADKKDADKKDEAFQTFV